jgi:hypothetical protein
MIFPYCQRHSFTPIQSCGKLLLSILWRIDPLLSRDLEMDEYSRCYAIGG